MNIDPHPVSFYNTFMKLGSPVLVEKLMPPHGEFIGDSPIFGGFFRPDHDPPCVF